MASTKEYLSFILEQLAPLPVHSRAMMGEFILYINGKIFGGIYDNRLLLKTTPTAVVKLPMAEEEIPYPGAKPMLFFEDVENAALLQEVVTAMEPELPTVKKKK